jgi:DtxR family Mn-dependent transcriptional regulator
VLSQTVEDYIKVIYKYQVEEGSPTVSTKDIAEALEISAASVTSMIKRISKMGLAEYKSHQGVKLTEAGKKVALEIIRHHRLLELNLSENMGYSWDEVHDEAEKLEHHISERFEDKIAELLDDPTHDPHGDPIPTKDGIMPELDEWSLAKANIHQAYMIARVKDQDPERLRYLEKEGLLPGARVEVKKREPFDGPVILLVEDHEKVIGHDLASTIFIAELSE